MVDAVEVPTLPRTLMKLYVRFELYYLECVSLSKY